MNLPSYLEIAMKLDFSARNWKDGSPIQVANIPLAFFCKNPNHNARENGFHKTLPISRNDHRHSAIQHGMPCVVGEHTQKVVTAFVASASRHSDLSAVHILFDRTGGRNDQNRTIPLPLRRRQCLAG